MKLRLQTCLDANNENLRYPRKNETGEWFYVDAFGYCEIWDVRI